MRRQSRAPVFPGALPTPPPLPPPPPVARPWLCCQASHGATVYSYDQRFHGESDKPAWVGGGGPGWAGVGWAGVGWAADIHFRRCRFLAGRLLAVLHGALARARPPPPPPPPTPPTPPTHPSPMSPPVSRQGYLVGRLTVPSLKPSCPSLDACPWYPLSRLLSTHSACVLQGYHVARLAADLHELLTHLDLTGVTVVRPSSTRKGLLELSKVPPGESRGPPAGLLRAPRLHAGGAPPSRTANHLQVAARSLGVPPRSRSWPRHAACADGPTAPLRVLCRWAPPWAAPSSGA